jgi:MFS family permease
VFIPVSGWVADRFGARTTFVSAIAVFCSAPSLRAQRLARHARRGPFVQGMGGAMMVPSAGSCCCGRSRSPRSCRRSRGSRSRRSSARWSGPPLGGFITTYFDWRYIFLINLPIGALGMILALRFIPNAREQPPPLDWLGFALAAAGSAPRCSASSTLGQHLCPSRSLAARSSLGLSSTRRLRRARAPPQRTRCSILSCSGSRRYAPAVVWRLLFRIGIGATPFPLPLMLQLGFGLSPVQSGF